LVDHILCFRMQQDISSNMDIEDPISLSFEEMGFDNVNFLKMSLDDVQVDQLDLQYDVPIPGPVPNFEELASPGHSTASDSLLSVTSEEENTKEGDESSSFEVEVPPTRSTRRRSSRTSARVNKSKPKRVTNKRSRETSVSKPKTKLVFDPRKFTGNAFDFSDAQLKEISSADLAVYTESAKQHHKFSDEENALLKKYRRRIKNREAAQKTRKKKKDQVDTLEFQLAEMQREREELDLTVGRMEKEVQSLRQHVHALENQLRNNGITPVQMNSKRRPRQRQGSTFGAGGFGSGGSTKYQAAGITLFMVLFSFGMFFSASPALRQMPIPDSTGHAVEATVTDQAFAQRQLLTRTVTNDLAQPKQETLRGLLRERPVNRPPPQIPIVVDYNKDNMALAPRPTGQVAKVHRQGIVGDGKVRIIEETAEQSGKTGAKDGALVPFGQDSGGIVRHHSEPSRHQKWDRPNTEYLFCPAAHHVMSKTESVDGMPSQVSLLLPYHALNGTGPKAKRDGKEPPLVEMVCSVVDIFPVWPNQVEGNNLTG